MQKKAFLSDIQHELEKQRREWGSEIKRLTQGISNDDKKISKTTSLVDQSSGKPTFKAYFDVREFDRDEVNVQVDSLTNKIVVKATNKKGILSRTLTQKANLPKFADTRNITKRIKSDGILEINIPLLYYFPSEDEAKSFVYRVDKRQENGRKCLEIVVNLTDGIDPEDVDLEVIDENVLVVSANSTGSSKSLKKRYHLPKDCDTENISAEITDDNNVTIYVPVVS